MYDNAFIVYLINFTGVSGDLQVTLSYFVHPPSSSKHAKNSNNFVGIKEFVWGDSHCKQSLKYNVFVPRHHLFQRIKLECHIE